MKFLVAFACFLALAAASPVPLDIAEVTLAEDTNGHYIFKVKSKAMTREEERGHDGKTLGSYTFVDPEGVEHKVTYVAAADAGYVVKSADLPVSVPESEELIRLRADHMAAVAADMELYPNGHPEEKPMPLADILAKLIVPEFANLPLEAVPAEDEENVEVRSQHLAEYAEVLARLAEAYKQMYH